MNSKWTPVDSDSALELTRATTAPGVVYPVATTAIPTNVQQMPGAVSYFVSGYTPQVSPIGAVTPGGEMLVIRTDGESGKAYNFVFGTSSDGIVCFNGPYKDFPQHHFALSSPVSVAAMFNNTPISPK